MAAAESRKMGKYTLLEKLGAGGSGEVYLAFSKMQNNIVQFFAVKILSAEQATNPRAIKMLKREASLANVLKHNSIVSLYECGTEGDDFYVAMDFVKGLPLSRFMHHAMLHKKTIAIEHALHIVRSVAAGLEYARTCKNPESGKPLNIVHRDISPQNIMINFEGEVKIIDFGLARTSEFNEKTQSDQIMGKLKYISPEHAKGEEVRHSSDVFSLGVVFWEMLSGRRFYQDIPDAGIVRWLGNPEHSGLIAYNPAVTPELDEIVAKACAGDVKNRYQSAGELYKDINSYLNMNYPNFSPHDFQKMIRTVFGKEMNDIDNKLAKYISQMGGDINLKKFESKFNQYADLVDSLGVIGPKEELRNTANTQEAVERFRNSRLAITEKKKQARGMWRNYELKKGVSISWKVATSLILISMVWSKMVRKDLSVFWSENIDYTKKVLGLKGEPDRDREPSSISKLGLKYPKDPVTVQIRTKPSGAKIYQNGKALRLQTPGLVKVIDEKSAEITLEYPGYDIRKVIIKPFEEEIYVDMTD